MLTMEDDRLFFCADCPETAVVRIDT